MRLRIRSEQTRPARGVLGAALVLVCLLAALGTAEAKGRSILILPFAPVDLPREERWMGDGVGESLQLALVHSPQLNVLDPYRLRHLPQPENWDEQSAVTAARALRADFALYGEVKRTGADLSVVPRYVEVKGDRVERGALDPIAVADGAFPERLRVLPAAYLRALKISVSDAEAARMGKSAVPTTNAKAYEAYVRGAAAAYRSTQEGREAAVEHLARAIELDAQFAVAQYAMGVVHHALGNRWKAAAQFRASTQLDKDYPEPFKALGDLLVTQPRRVFDQAIEAYETALKLRPFFAEAHVGLGDAKAAKGDVDGAIASYQKALLIDTANARVHASLGKIYYTEKNQYYEAVNSYKKAIDLDPKAVEPRMGLAEVYEEKGLYPDAIGEYKKVVELDPKHTGALYNLAQVYEKVDPRESIALWERYIELAGAQPSEKDWVDVAKLHLRKLRQQFPKTN